MEIPPATVEVGSSLRKLGEEVTMQLLGKHLDIWQDLAFKAIINRPIIVFWWIYAWGYGGDQLQATTFHGVIVNIEYFIAIMYCFDIISPQI